MRDMDLKIIDELDKMIPAEPEEPEETEVQPEVVTAETNNIRRKKK